MNNRFRQLVKLRATSVIPQGMYCYDTYTCPYWSTKYNLPHQENGYCKYLRKSDVDLFKENHWCSLLWDMCKECGINDE